MAPTRALARTQRYAAAKPPGVNRLLFIGDSVTHRGQIVEALRAVYGSQKYEYWNAGVESFNTVQEVEYYRRFNRAINPDHVILTFHLNDFETTPVAFREADGTLVVFAPNWPVRRLNPWLFQHSYTYRYWLGLVTPKKTARSEIIAEVRASLTDLQRMVGVDRARLTVLVLPILRPYSDGSLSTKSTGAYSRHTRIPAAPLFRPAEAFERGAGRWRRRDRDWRQSFLAPKP